MTELDLVASWAKAFGVTLVVELVVAARMLARDEPRLPRRILVVLVAQLATHPIVWFVIPAFRLPRPLYLACAELWAVGIEAVIYALSIPTLGKSRVLFVSLVTNAASVAVGLALRAAGILP